MRVIIVTMLRLPFAIIYFFCLCWLTLIHGPTVAQDIPKIIVGTAYQRGAIILHSPKIRHFAEAKPVGIELNLQYQTRGKKYWQQLYKYPRVGTSFVYLNYQHPVLGQSFALSPYMSLPVLKRKTDRLYFRFGSGLAYFSNRFNRIQNPGNNVISSAWNAVIQTRLEYDFQLHRHLQGVAAIGLNHYSNGGNSKPNLGINIATATLGMQVNTYYKQPFIVRDAPFIGRRNFLTLSSSMGLKQRSDFDTTRYVVKSVALTAIHRLNQKSNLLLGLEGFYDPSLFARRALDPRITPGSTPDIKRIGLITGHELKLGKVALGTQVGWYVYRPYKSDAPFFQRLETKVHLHQNLFVAAGLKLHDVIKADIIEYRIGISI